MAKTPSIKVIVHKTRKGWTWSQISANGSVSAVAPTVYDNKANARRAGVRQVDNLNRAGQLVAAEQGVPAPTYAELVVDEGYVRR